MSALLFWSLVGGGTVGACAFLTWQYAVGEEWESLHRALGEQDAERAAALARIAVLEDALSTLMDEHVDDYGDNPDFESLNAAVKKGRAALAASASTVPR